MITFGSSSSLPAAWHPLRHSRYCADLSGCFLYGTLTWSVDLCMRNIVHGSSGSSLRMAASVYQFCRFQTTSPPSPPPFSSSTHAPLLYPLHAFPFAMPSHPSPPCTVAPMNGRRYEHVTWRVMELLALTHPGLALYLPLQDGLQPHPFLVISCSLSRCWLHSPSRPLCNKASKLQ